MNGLIAWSIHTDGFVSGVMAHETRNKAMARSCLALKEAGYVRTFGEALHKINVNRSHSELDQEWARTAKPGDWRER